MPMKPTKFKRFAKWSIAGLVLILVAMQFVPVGRTNPAAGSDPPFPEEVRSILSRSCYDCHSNETVWPWYSRIAPLSWLIAHDVSEGREKVNFSTWDRLGAGERIKAIGEIGDEVTDGGMPLWYYLPAHPEARLSPEDVAVLRAWALAEARGESDDDH